MQDPGACTVALAVRNLDTVIARFKRAGISIVSAGGVPADLGGDGTRYQAVIVRDPDGHFVEVGPLFQDEIISFVEDAGGGALRERFLATAKSFDTSSSLAARADPARRSVRPAPGSRAAWPAPWQWRCASFRHRSNGAARGRL